jgi:formylglycine-generating enzyme required for sulfatase activity
VVVEVSDGALSSTGQFNVSVLEVNKPPLVIPVSPGSVAEGQTWSVTLSASDPDMPANRLVFRLVSGPDGSSLDSNTGVLKWTPTEADGGKGYEWMVEVTDDGQPQLVSQATVQLTVLEVNEPPSLNPLPDVTLKPGQSWSVTLNGTDNDLPMQTLTYALKTAPVGMVLDGQTRQLRWVPSEAQSPGNFPVTVTLTDSGGAVAERSFVVKVAEADQPPLMKIGALMADGSFSIEIRASEGATVILEASGDLHTWVEAQIIAGKGFGNPILISIQAHPEVSAKFWRARLKISDSKPVGPSGFVWIPPGTFTMGSPITEAERGGDEVQHLVTLTRGFWLSDHEVTQGEFESVMGSNPSWHKGDSNRPVEKVTWESAILYCQKLTERDRAVGRITSQQSYRLPTEAEWEYAARAGSTGVRYGNLDDIGWYLGNSGLGPHPVKQKSPNAWGLYDMLGNVWEWCSDHWADYPTGAAVDPVGPNTGSLYVFRGGAWGNEARFSRSASRWGSDSSVLSVRNDLGFRPVLSVVR